ncbi:MAG: hypothetical protein ACLPWS_15255 [Rhodomicrobium sp.]
MNKTILVEQLIRLEQRLIAINKQVEWMADQEARSAWVKGLAAQGALAPTKSSLIDEAEKVIDRAEDILKQLETMPRSSS